jgi:serine protease inhibitor
MSNNYNRNNLNNNDKNNMFLLDRNFELNDSALNNNYIDREYLIGINTRTDENKGYLQKYTDKFKKNDINNANKNMSGEITGFNLNNIDVISGMPLRDNFKNLNVNKKGNNNKYTDFNIYNKNINIVDTNVKYNNINDEKISFINDNKESNNDLIKRNKVDIMDMCNDINCSLFSNFQESLGKKNIVTIGTYSIILNLLILYRGSHNKTEKLFSDFFSNISKDNLYNIISETRITNNKNLKMINNIYLSNKYVLNKSYNNYVNKLSKIYNIDTNDPYEYSKINEDGNKTLDNISMKILADDILSDKDLVLSNVIFFRTKFKIPFSRLNNKKRMFQSYKKKKLITMMTIKNIVTEYYEDKYYKILELECQDNNNIGLIIPKVFNCPALTWNRLSYYIKELKRDVIGEITIPKFKDHCKYKIDNILNKMNLGSLYDSIDISDITPNEDNLKLSSYFHQVLLIVDEGGISSYNISDKSNNDKKFIADHPFIYYIRDKESNMLLIMGMYK